MHAHFHRKIPCIPAAIHIGNTIIGNGSDKLHSCDQRRLWCQRPVVIGFLYCKLNIAVIIYGSKVRESSLKSVMVCSVQFKCCLPLQKWKDSAVPKPSVQNHAPPSLIPEHRKLIADDLRLFAHVVLGSTHTAYIQTQTYLFIHFFQAPPALIIFLILLFILIQPREADFRLFQQIYICFLTDFKYH